MATRSSSSSTFRVFRESQLSGRKHFMDLPISKERYEEACIKYKSGTLLKYAFPTLSISQREFILTGITAEEWDEAFAEAGV